MKIKLRPDDPDMLQEPDWRQMNGWLAEIRDDGHAQPASDDQARRAPGCRRVACSDDDGSLGAPRCSQRSII